MSYESTGDRRDHGTEATGMLVLAALALAALPAVLSGLLASAWIRGDEQRATVRRLATLGLGIGALGAAWLLRPWYLSALAALSALLATPRQAHLWPALRTLWLAGLPLAPWVALVASLAGGRSVEAVVLRAERRQTTALRRQRTLARRLVARAPDALGGELVLGAWIGGDLLDWQQRGWLRIPACDLRRHAVAVGSSGSGKTETLLRLAYLARRVHGWQVLYIDAKGDRATARRFLGSMQAAGTRRVAYFPDQAYDGWRGDARAMLNRLHAAQRFSEPYYEDIAALTLDLALSAPGGPPRSSDDLLRRLRRDALEQLYQGDPGRYKVDQLRADDVRSVFARYAGFLGALREQLNGSWALEDVEAAYLLLDGTALKRETESVGRWLVEEIAQYITTRKPPDRQVLVIIDEFSALSMAADAAALFERIRSFGAAVIVSSQSYAGLGGDADRLLGAAGCVLLHTSSDSEALVTRAGTLARLEQVFQTDAHGVTGQASVRQARTRRVDPDAVRQLATGECFVISGGHAARIQVAQIPAPPPVMPGPDPSGAQVSQPVPGAGPVNRDQL